MKKQMMFLAAALVLTVGNFAHASAEAGDWKNDPSMSEVAKQRANLGNGECPFAHTLASGNRMDEAKSQVALKETKSTHSGVAN